MVFLDLVVGSALIDYEDALNYVIIAGSNSVFLKDINPSQNPFMLNPISLFMCLILLLLWLLRILLPHKLINSKFNAVSL